MDMPLSKTPGLKPPPGVSSDFHAYNPLNRILLGTVVACLALTALLMTIRFIVRLKCDKTLHLEDCTATACWIGFVTYNGIALAIGNEGAGRHQWDVSVASIIRIGLLGNVIEIVYGPTIWLAKLSVLLQYMRIFTHAKKPGLVYWSIQFLIWANFLFYLTDTFIVAFECQPRAKIWNFLLPGTCLNATANFIVTGAWNVFSDFLILTLPVYAIWHLKMPLKRKFSVSAVFATGAFACIASVLRLYYSVKWARSKDVTYVFMQVALWGLAELATVVICGSVIFLPRFVQLLQGRKWTTKYGQSPQYGSTFQRMNRSRRARSQIAPWSEDDRITFKHDESYTPIEGESIGQHIPLDSANADQVRYGHGIQKTTHVEVDGL